MSYMELKSTTDNLSLYLNASFSGRCCCWAGEHTHTTRYGTVDGAMDTGEREAKKIIAYRKATRG